MVNQSLATMFAVAMFAIAGIARGDVFNMGGTQNADGTWTGLASLQFVTVGNPRNAADTVIEPDGTTGYGSVPYVYQMGKYDVTVAQYCQFLNAVATTGDPYGLYKTGMATDMPTFGIGQGGSPGNYSYSVTGSYSQGGNCPIFDVTWGDAARFCNWLQNGQGTATTVAGAYALTETGAYSLGGGTSDAALVAVTRNPGAIYSIPSENEYYKAAYYDPTLNGGAGGYWIYPTKSNTTPSNVLSSTGTNNANNYNVTYTDSMNYLTPVGSFISSPGAYDTYDMGGDVLEWNEAVISGEPYFPGLVRGMRAGAFSVNPIGMASLNRYYWPPTNVNASFGFRVESVPEPSIFALLAVSAIAVVGYGRWKRLLRNPFIRHFVSIYAGR